MWIHGKLRCWLEPQTFGGGTGLSAWTTQTQVISTSTDTNVHARVCVLVCERETNKADVT